MWANQYAPANLAEVTGHLNGISRCKEWLRRFPDVGKISDRVLLISGPEGCGKSLIAHLLLTEAGYKVHSFSLREIRNHKKDQDLLSNFCQLYVSNLRHLGAPHALIVDDFDSVAKADKIFHSALVELVKTQPTNSNITLPPLILTMTTKADISEKQRTQNYQGLAKVATEVVLSPIRQSDMEEVLDRICRLHGIKTESKVCTFLAEHALGDARKGIQSLQLLALSKSITGVITNDQAAEWMDVNAADDDEKLVYSSTVSAHGTDEERILRAAIRDDDSRVQKSAKQLVIDNSIQFTPLLFQAYPTLIDSLHGAAEIADDFSLADVVKENSWSSSSAEDPDDCGHMSLSAMYSIEIPLARLVGSKRPVRTSGYQTYYGVKNTISSQGRAIVSVKTHNPKLFSASTEELNLLQIIVSQLLKQESDEEIVKRFHDLGIRPDVLENLSRIKGVSDPSIDLKLSKKRQRELCQLYDDLHEEKTTATIKFVPEPEKKKATVSNDIFSPNWN